MAGGPIFPFSIFPTDGNVFDYTYVGGGANSKQDNGIGVSASLAADTKVEMRFAIPPTVPTGTLKLRLLALANATSGAAKVTVKDINVAAGASPSGASLNSETQTTITWSTGDNDKYKEAKVTLTTTPSGNDILVVTLLFSTSGWTLAQISCWQAYLLWE